MASAFKNAIIQLEDASQPEPGDDAAEEKEVESAVEKEEEN